MRSASSTRRGAHVGGKLPAHDAPAPDVDHEAQEDEALPAAQVGEIRDPELVRPGCLEAPLDEIRQPAHELGLRCLPALGAALGAADPGLAHEPGDAVTPDLVPGAAQREPGLARPVGLVVGQVQLTDQRQQPLVLDRLAGSGRRSCGGSRRTPTRPARCRSARRRSDHGTYRCTRSLRPVCVELLGEKHRRRLQDLIRPPQLEVLAPQLADLLPLGSSSAAPGADPGRPRPAAHAVAASPTRSPDQPRSARSAAHSRAPAARPSRSAHPGTSWASHHGLLSARTESSHQSLRGTQYASHPPRLFGLGWEPLPTPPRPPVKV